MHQFWIDCLQNNVFTLVEERLALAGLLAWNKLPHTQRNISNFISNLKTDLLVTKMSLKIDLGDDT